MNNDSGFSLVELLVTMAIISIVAAILIPSLMLSRQAANEAGAIEGCRLIATAEMAYAALHDQQFADIASLIDADLLDQKYASDEPVGGYRYAFGDVRGTDIDGELPSSFGFIATPEPGAGRYLYAIAPDQIVRYQGPAEGFTLPSGIAAGEPVEEAGRSETSEP
jgi:prepilin-type N-terminal cleavage/methylation domain-containing protein